MLIKEPRKKRSIRKDAGGGTVRTKSHAHGERTIAGHEERLASYVKRAIELKRQGHPLYRMAEMMADEFQMESIPHITTVMRWSKQGLDAINEDVRELQMDLRISQLNNIHRLMAKWLPIALKDHLQIQRWEMVEGEKQPFMDENAVAEQLKATKEVVNLMAREAKLMGIDLEKIEAKDADGFGSLQEMQLFIIQQVVNVPQQKDGKIIDQPGQVLELTSGIEEGDSV